MSDDDLLTQIRATFPTLDGWRDKLADIIEPSPGSELAVDDEEWPYLRSSTLVQVGLASAREHLHVVRLGIEAEELFPAATATLCRSSLIGASLAVWVLTPDERSERLRRSLSLAVEGYRRHIQFGRDVMGMSAAVIAPTADEQLGRLELRLTQVLSLLDNHGGVRDVNLTDEVVPSALEVAVPDAAQREQFTMRWRGMSGAAHALTWHFFGYEGTSASEVDAGGVGRVAVKGDLGRLTMDYFTAYHVARAGWRLLERRSRVEPDDAPEPG